jgi:uncharacterized protein (TIGR03000 family)
MAPFLRKVVALLLLVLPVGSAVMVGEAARAAEPPSGSPALVAVRVPPDAELWFEGSKMAPTGAIRVFRSPPLAPGKLYGYEVRVRWLVGEQEETRTRTVLVTAGEAVGVDFTGPVWTAAPRPREATALAKAR